MNSFLFSNSRMLFSARPRARDVQRERRADERAVLVRVDPRRSLRERRRPVPDACDDSGAFVMIGIFIIVAHFAMRRQDSTHHAIRRRSARGFIRCRTGSLLALVAVLGSQAFNPDSRFQFWFTVLTALAIVAAYFLRRKPATRRDGRREGALTVALAARRSPPLVARRLSRSTSRLLNLLAAQPNGRTPISQPCRNSAKTAHDGFRPRSPRRRPTACPPDSARHRGGHARATRRNRPAPMKNAPNSTTAQRAVREQVRDGTPPRRPPSDGRRV